MTARMGNSMVRTVKTTGSIPVVFMVAMVFRAMGNIIATIKSPTATPTTLLTKDFILAFTSFECLYV